MKPINSFTKNKSGWWKHETNEADPVISKSDMTGSASLRFWALLQIQVMIIIMMWDAASSQYSQQTSRQQAEDLIHSSSSQTPENLGLPKSRIFQISPKVGRHFWLTAMLAATQPELATAIQSHSQCHVSFRVTHSHAVVAICHAESLTVEAKVQPLPPAPWACRLRFWCSTLLAMGVWKDQGTLYNRVQLFVLRILDHA